MRERPILFSGPMVRALLEGRKTQTRREVKPQTAILTDEMARAFGVRPPEVENSAVVRCPYGVVGDRLWVRETFFDVRPWRHEPLFGGIAGDFIYRAEYEYREAQGRPDVLGGRDWRPSIFMPRAASRLTLEITSVRVERLTSISAADARAEGAPNIRGEFDYCDWYRDLWDQLNGSGSWSANPWVWVVEFKRVDGEVRRG